MADTVAQGDRDKAGRREGQEGRTGRTGRKGGRQEGVIAHLLRGAGFGASAAELAVCASLSYPRAVDRIVSYSTLPDAVDSHIGQTGYVNTTSLGPFSPNTVADDARQRWRFRMVHSDRPLQEKVTLFWHTRTTATTSSPKPICARYLCKGDRQLARRRFGRRARREFPQAGARVHLSARRP